jgi:hypothetical protein
VQVYFQYDFMPPGILSRLIVRLNEIIDVQNGSQIVWERGVLFKRDSSSAEIIESQHKKQLTIKVSGESFVKNKELLTIVRNEIRKIHKDWFDDRLSFQEMVPCICNECQKSEPIFYTLGELEKRLQNNKETIECRKSYQDVAIIALLEGIYVEQSQHEKSSKYRIADSLHIYGNPQINHSDNFDTTISEIEDLRQQNLVDETEYNDLVKSAVVSLVIESTAKGLSELPDNELNS